MPPHPAFKGGSNYATTGTHRFDRVTVNVTAVPEPESCALMPAGAPSACWSPAAAPDPGGHHRPAIRACGR